MILFLMLAALLLVGFIFGWAGRVVVDQIKIPDPVNPDEPDGEYLEESMEIYDAMMADPEGEWEPNRNTFSGLREAEDRTERG